MLGFPSTHLGSAPFLLVGVFVVAMMAVTAALPAHMISLLRENGLAEAWVIPIPASIGVGPGAGPPAAVLLRTPFQPSPGEPPHSLPDPARPDGAAGRQAWRAALLFVLLYGLGNGMLTIVKDAAIAQYVSRDHVASLNGALGVPTAIARALAPWLLGVLWTREAGYC